MANTVKSFGYISVNDIHLVIIAIFRKPFVKDSK